MSLSTNRPLIYLITSGSTTPLTTPKDPSFLSILNLIDAAVAAQVSLIQLREKTLTTRVLFELARESVRRTKGTETRLLINDRFDVALSTGADGVQLTSTSLPADVVRQTCGPGFLIGVSTHSHAEASVAKGRGADFALFGPVFDTESKRVFGPPQGVSKLKELTSQLDEFPVIAIGGVSVNNAKQCIAARAAGVAGISMLREVEKLKEIVSTLRQNVT